MRSGSVHKKNVAVNLPLIINNGITLPLHKIHSDRVHWVTIHILLKYPLKFILTDVNLVLLILYLRFLLSVFALCVFFPFFFHEFPLIYIIDFLTISFKTSSAYKDFQYFSDFPLKDKISICVVFFYETPSSHAWTMNLNSSNYLFLF